MQPALALCPHARDLPPPAFDPKKVYRVKCANPDGHPGYLLTGHSVYEQGKDKRSKTSIYACIHLPGWKGSSWRILQVPGTAHWRFVMTEDTDFHFTSKWTLCTRDELGSDTPDSTHTRVVLHAPEPPGDSWIVTPTGHGTFIITLADGPRAGWHLCPFYPNNERLGGKSFYACVSKPRQGPAPHWDIEPR
ncbi:hypothetical protein DIPPA_16337 [Diplonema papillatum]|nr:hypothetical protein DIPPA_16337 [Diplonema papillatum]